MSKYRNRSGKYRQSRNEDHGSSDGKSKDGVDQSKRKLLAGGLIGFGGAVITFGGVLAATRQEGPLVDFGDLVGPSNPAHTLLFLDGTDREATSAFQTDAIARAFLKSNKHLYDRGATIDVGRFGQHISSPLELEAHFQSPGNEETSGGFFSTPSELERSWLELLPQLNAAIENALRPMAEPEATLVFDVLDRGVEHARRESGSDAKINVLVATDGLVHSPPNGFSAYVSESSARFPAHGSPLVDQLSSSSLEGVSIQIVGIRRDGRKTRSGRDLGPIQRKVMPFLIDHWSGRGADVSAASLTWV
ncbi:MAG: hypothetical protein AAF636_19305 [Pseudomonadota bacterium]